MLLEYACFHKADLEEAMRDRDDADEDGESADNSNHSRGDSTGNSNGNRHGLGERKGSNEFEPYSHKVRRKTRQGEASRGKARRGLAV